MRELPTEPSENRYTDGYPWSPKDDDYWDMRYDQMKDEVIDDEA